MASCSRSTSAPDWRDRTTTRRSGTRVLEIPDEELWNARTALRQYLFAFIRERARQRWREEQVSAAASSPPARCSTPTR